MTILHRYILGQLVGKIATSLLGFVTLFLVFDFFDRIDNILAESPSVATILLYFILKIPFTLTLMIPVSMLSGTLLTFGIMSKSSEVTAMRAAGCSLWWIAKPIFITGLSLGLFSLILNETLVPVCQRRVREIYNLDIKQKDKTGTYSRSNLWWRSKNKFFSAATFDSRNNELLDVTMLEVDNSFEVLRRLVAAKASYLDESLGWSLNDVTRYQFSPTQSAPSIDSLRALPLPISKTPKDLYDADTDPFTMNFSQLRRFIRDQERNGIYTRRYYADLYEKLSFPLLSALIGLVVFPFALLPARSGSMSRSVLAALCIGFSYYVVHSLSLSLGRAEFMPALVAAWLANILFLAAGTILVAGADAPQ